jgi:enolase
VQGKPLFRYISELYGANELIIPMPVVNVMSRNVAGSSCAQDITITPVVSSTIESALEQILKAVNSVRSKLDESKVPYSTSVAGSFQVNMGSLEEAVLVSIGHPLIFS